MKLMMFILGRVSEVLAWVKNALKKKIYYRDKENIAYLSIYVSTYLSLFISFILFLSPTVQFLFSLM